MDWYTTSNYGGDRLFLNAKDVSYDMIRLD